MPLRVPADILIRTPIYRMVHIDNLPTLLAREAIHAPACCPADGLPYRGIHAHDVQAERAGSTVPCGPGGAIGQYVGFYFGPRSPMLMRIQTGRRVAQCDKAEIVYLIATAQSIAAEGLRYVFTDRHTLAAVAAYYDDLASLGEVDFQTAYLKYWSTTAEHPERQEKKQAEFLVHQQVPWHLIERIAVSCAATRERVEAVLAGSGAGHVPVVGVELDWYY